MRNIIFRVLAGLLGVIFIWALYISVLDARFISILYLVSGIYSLIFALGGYDAIQKSSVMIENFSQKLLSFFKKS